MSIYLSAIVLDISVDRIYTSEIDTRFDVSGSFLAVGKFLGIWAL